MNKQNTDTILMVRPVNFHFNEETAKNNYYQKNTGDFSEKSANELAQIEFDSFANKLKDNGIRVLIVEDTLEPVTPDSIFPNNWVSFHQDGRIGIYPMFAHNRRLERRTDIFDLLKEKGYTITEVVDMTAHELNNLYMEGTGSVVLDRENKIAYAALSVRTSKEGLADFCQKFGYTSVAFTAYQSVNNDRLPIYHTNVMMCVADRFAVICLATIDDEREKKEVIQSLESSGKEIITISETQKHHFAGNMLQLHNVNGDKFTVMSSAAYNSLDEEQIKKIAQYGSIIHSSLSTIEQLGGGSARCMMAEMFLPKKN